MITKVTHYVHARHAERLRARLGPVGVFCVPLITASAADACAAARRLEELGYGALWIGESPSTKEVFAHAAALLAATERLVVASGIANVWMREPAAMVAGAATLSDAYQDRFLLGVGASHQGSIEQLGRTPRGPLTVMREYLDGMDGAPYAGPLPDDGVPRVLAALRPRMVDLARERAAGAHPYFVPVEHTARTRAALGPDRLLAPEQAFILDADPAAARERAREHVHAHITRASYAASMRSLGFTDEDLADGGSDRLVDATVAFSDVDAVAARVQAHLDAGADHVVVQALTPDLDVALEQLATIRAALPRAAATRPTG